MKIKITVTEEHIKNGTCGNPFTCPVALALKEQTKIGWSVVIYFRPRYASIENFKENQIYKQPRSVRRFITKFDKTKKGKPFSFILDSTKIPKL